VKAFELLGQATAPDGGVIKLIRRGGDYLIMAGDAVLMSSRLHGSEEALAGLGCQRASTLQRPCVLVGGLGMGFTVRAALDRLPADATVVVSELVPAVVEWNRGPLGALAGNPLSDSRVRIDQRDVAETIALGVGEFDAILLDVDNGPEDLTTEGNAAIYTSAGIAAVREALKTRGILTIWAAKNDTKFQRQLRNAGFKVHVQIARDRANRGGRHTVFVAYKIFERS
jgi:spermidine synthase